MCMDEWCLTVCGERIECIMITVVPVTLNWIQFEHFVENPTRSTWSLLFTVDGLLVIG